jgi:hypothetical protein
VCHQSVGLIARRLEAEGIPTTSLSSARDITLAVGPPRAAFVDYPLGHTSGKPQDPEDQRAIVEGALDLLRSATQPGRVVDLGRVWSNDETIDRAWRSHPLSSQGSGGDGRGTRTPEPVYQSDQDRVLALRAATTRSSRSMKPGQPP